MAEASSPGFDRQSAPLSGAHPSVGTGDEWDSPASEEGLVQLGELRGFLDLPIEVGVQLGRRLITFREVLELRVGSVIRMERSAGENVDLLLERGAVGRGEIVVIEDMMGLRITELAYPGAATGSKAAEK